MKAPTTAFVLALVICGGMGAPGCGGDDAAAPSAPGWTALADMPEAIGEAAAATDGTAIYVAGGFDTRPTFQIYSLSTQRWTTGPSLIEGTDNAGLIFHDGKLTCFGGEATPAVQTFDLAAQRWTNDPILPSQRFSAVVELLGGEVHLVGGWSFSRANNVSVLSHDVLDLATGAYVPGGRAQLGTARNHAYSGVIDGKLYVTGGRAPGHEADGANIASTEVYDPATDAWTPAADLPTPRSGGASAVLGGKLYVLGGGLPGNQVYRTIDRFDPSTGQWETLADMPVYATGQRAVAIGNDLYLVGGFTTNGDQRTGEAGVKRFWRYTPP